MYIPGRLRTASRPSRTWVVSGVVLRDFVVAVFFAAVATAMLLGGAAGDNQQAANGPWTARPPRGRRVCRGAGPAAYRHRQVMGRAREFLGREGFSCLTGHPGSRVDERQSLEEADERCTGTEPVRCRPMRPVWGSGLRAGPCPNGGGELLCAHHGRKHAPALEGHADIHDRVRRLTTPEPTTADWVRRLPPEGHHHVGARVDHPDRDAGHLSCPSCRASPAHPARRPDLGVDIARHHTVGDLRPLLRGFAAGLAGRYLIPGSGSGHGVRTGNLVIAALCGIERDVSHSRRGSATLRFVLGLFVLAYLPQA